MFRKFTFAAALLASVAQVQGAGSACPVPGTFCLYGQPDGQGNVIFTVHSSAAGWQGFGTGSGMVNSDIFVVYQNGKGGYTVSPRHASAKRLPDPVNVPYEVVPLVVPAPAWANIAVSFKTPAGTKYTAKTSYIYALSQTKPEQPESPTSAFRKHDKKGVIGVVDFVSPPKSAVASAVSLGQLRMAAAVDSSNQTTANSTVNSGKVCPRPESLCFYGSTDADGNAQITIHSDAKGWVALGTGEGMKNSDIYMAWKNSTGGVTVSARKATGYKPPSPTNETLKVVPLAVEAPSWANIAVTFVKTNKGASLPQLTSQTKYIYASSAVAPANVDDASSPIKIHNDVGVIGTVDLIKAVASSNATSEPTATSSASPSPSSSASPAPEKTGAASHGWRPEFSVVSVMASSVLASFFVL